MKKLLKLWRTFREGLSNFLRNGWLSLATVSVLTVSLYIMGVTVLVGIGSGSALKNIQEKINISVYFNPEVNEARILEIKGKLAGYREIKSIDYVSKNQALDEFLRSGNNDPSITQALEEIGDNPLLASLVIKAQSPEQYDIIAKAIDQSNFREEISRINYEKNKEAIVRLNNFIHMVEKVGFILGTIFIFVAILVTFNTIRITMYSHRQEFEVMRLVGASNMYVRMPYVFEGIFYGIASALSVLLLLFITFQFVAPAVQGVISRSSLISFYFQYFSFMAFFLFFSGIMLGVISSFIAIRRYLKA
jgi:cell division transport system permease protein